MLESLPSTRHQNQFFLSIGGVAEKRCFMNEMMEHPIMAAVN